MNTANRATRRASKSNKATAKASQATASVKKDKSSANPAPAVANTAQERIAAMGDNIRPFYTAINSVVADIHDTEVQYKAKSDNQSLDLLISVYAARDVFSPKLAELVKGNKTTPSAKAVQATWLQTYVPAYHDALRASEKKVEGKDFYSRQKAEDSIAAESKAVESIRVMFERVFMAAYWLEYIKAENIGTAKKGKTRGLTYDYLTEETVTASDGSKTTKVVKVPGIDSVTQLTASGRDRVNTEKANAGEVVKGAKGKGSKSKPKSPAVQESNTTVATLQTIGSELAGLTTKPDERATVVASPAFEVTLCRSIALKFATFPKATTTTSKPTIKTADIVAWIVKQKYFEGFTFIEDKPTADIIKPTTVLMDGKTASGKTAAK